MRRKLLGNDHPRVADSLLTLARVLCEEGKLPEAEALIREALAIQERTGDSRSSAWALHLLAKVLAPEGRSAEAEAAIHKAVAIEKQFNDDNLRIWNLRTLGLVLAHEGKLAEAEAVYREDLQFMKSTFDKTHVFSAVLTDLGDTLYQQGRFAEAETMYRQALAARRSGSGNEMRTAESLNNLATALHAEGQLDEAEPLAREGLAICEKKVPDNWNWRTFDARRLLGGILVGQKKYAEAEPLLRSGYEGIKQQLDKIPLYCNPHLKGALQKQALEGLVQLYEATGRPDQAAEWKKTLEETTTPIPVTTSTSDAR
jgi:tetratricopeptide (TPR) repeat protein